MGAIIASHDSDAREKPWERQEGETELAWNRFRAFLAMEPPRKREEAAQMFGCARPSLDRMAANYHWTERAAAWDAHLARAVDEATLDHVVEVRKRHLRRVRRLQDKLTRIMDEAAGSDLDPIQSARLNVDLMRFERLLVGEAESRQEHTMSLVRGPVDVGLLTTSERVELQGLIQDPAVQRMAELLQKARRQGGA